MKRFEEIIAWQKAKELAVFIYRIFRANRDYGFRDQIQRAVVSIGNNIAEGFERQSDKELKQFLFIAKGSCGEVRSMTYLAQDLGYLKEQESVVIRDSAQEISRMLAGFIKKL